MTYPHRSTTDDWPPLRLEDWADTMATLHMWTQIVGKIRLTLSPWMNHSWHVTLYVSSRGLTTSPMWYGSRMFEIEFDFLKHRLIVQTAEGDQRIIALEAKSVARFYTELMDALEGLGINVTINPTPSEIADGIPFAKDEVHDSYDPAKVQRFWRALVQIDRVFKVFRSTFTGKSSPVHFFWGSFDLAVTRFCGRVAPPHPGGIPNFPDPVAREAYSHEVISAGFWPGGDGIEASFYAYAYPEPAGFREANVTEGAYYSDELGEFLLPYETVRKAASPDELLLDFLNTTYEQAANLADWAASDFEADFDHDGPK